MQIAFTWCFPVLKICSRKVLPRNHRSSMREKCWCDFLDRLVCGVPCGKAFKYQTEQPQPLGRPGGDLGKKCSRASGCKWPFQHPLEATCIHSLQQRPLVQPLAATCSQQPLAATCSQQPLAATCSHLQPLAATCSHLQPLAATCSHCRENSQTAC